MAFKNFLIESVLYSRKGDNEKHKKESKQTIKNYGRVDNRIK